MSGRQDDSAGNEITHIQHTFSLFNVQVPESWTCKRVFENSSTTQDPVRVRRVKICENVRSLAFVSHHTFNIHVHRAPNIAVMINIIFHCIWRQLQKKMRSRGRVVTFSCRATTLIVVKEFDHIYSFAMKKSFPND